jgi:transcriptional regulator with XRE-family HTH domain
MIDNNSEYNLNSNDNQGNSLCDTDASHNTITDNRHLDNSPIDNNNDNQGCPYSYVGAGLRAVRLGHDLKQIHVAKALNITVSAYSHYECGHRIPDLIILIKLCIYYKINITYFIFLLCMDYTRSEEVDTATVFRIFAFNQLFNEEETYILETFRSLSSTYREDVISFINSAKQCREWDTPIML